MPRWAIGWASLIGAGASPRARRRQLSEWAFAEYKLTRVFALVFSHNLASIRVLEKAGFQQEGILRRSAIKNGVVLDQLIFAKVK